MFKHRKFDGTMMVRHHYYHCLNFWDHLAKQIERTIKNILTLNVIYNPNTFDTLTFPSEFKETSKKPMFTFLITVKEFLSELSDTKITEDQVIAFFTMFEKYKPQRSASWEPSCIDNAFHTKLCNINTMTHITSKYGMTVCFGSFDGINMIIEVYYTTPLTYLDYRPFLTLMKGAVNGLSAIDIDNASDIDSENEDCVHEPFGTSIDDTIKNMSLSERITHYIQYSRAIGDLDD
jgi:hypothetical protein